MFHSRALSHKAKTPNSSSYEKKDIGPKSFFIQCQITPNIMSYEKL